MKPAIDLGPGSPLLSLTGDFFRMHQRSEISIEEFLLANADWVEKNSFKYPIMNFPSIPMGASDYTFRRFSDGEYDAEKAKVLGTWFKTCLGVADDNVANLSLLGWAKVALNAKGIETPRIDATLERASKINNYDDFFAKVLEVKRKDAEVPVSRKRG